MFRQIKAHVMQALPCATPENLSGFTADVDYYLKYRLDESGVLSKVDVVLDPDRTVLVRAEPGSRASSVQDIARGVRAAWGDLEYSEFSATSHRVEESRLVIHFITATDTYHVALRVEVSGGRYGDLAREYGRHWSFDSDCDAPVA